MAETNGESWDEEKQSEENLNETSAEETSQGKLSKVEVSDSEKSSLKYNDFKPGLSSNALSSSEEADHSSRHPSWNEFSSYHNATELWAAGEQELIGEGKYEIKEIEESCESETQDTSSSGTKEKSDDDSATSSEALSNVYSKLSPFNIQWSFGINVNMGLINLTTTGAFEVFYVSSHFGVIYNYVLNTMTFLPGHNYLITSIDADTSGRWLVTADAGEDTVIIIWDRKKKLPVWSLYNVFPGEGVSCAKISQDARFLAAINCDFKYTLKFWLWTYGREKPDGEMDIDPAHGKVKHIDFNHTNTEQFVITTEIKVIFCEWEKKVKKLKSYVPIFEIRKKKQGILRESIFLDDRHTALTSTSQGYIIVWCDIKYTDPIIEKNPGTIQRNFLKAIKLHKSGITSLKLCDKVIATSSEEGIILFHDQQFRLMYCLSKLNLGPVVSISFNIDYIPCSSDPFSNDFLDANGQFFEYEEIKNVLEYDENVQQKNSEDSELEQNKASSNLLVKKKIKCDNNYPPDCTIEMKDFIIRDFMFLMTSGKIGYLSHTRQKVAFYLYDTEAPVLSMDCNPNKPHLVMGYAQGRLTLYEYNLKKSLLSVTFSNAITTLKYSAMGYSLMAGFQNGELLELDSLLLTVKAKLETSKAPIVKICFSDADELLAFYDQSSTVQVCKKKGPNHQWVSMGKYISHYKPIVDILFEEQHSKSEASRLFTIGQDRMLVEYDMKHLEENKLKVLHMIRIEQTAIPCCFTWLHEMYQTPHFLISNDQYKLKVLNAETHGCIKTTLGPTADTPIRYMKITQDPEKGSNKSKMVYTTEKHIGIKILPPTGNPFEGMGMIAHPGKLAAIAISHDHKYIFTVGTNELSPLMWEINYTSVEVACQLGGVGLEPFVSLIEGGPKSFLFKEIEDFFYYSQIIHQGEDPNIDRSVSKNLSLCEIPDLFRALGYFPTDYEVDNLLQELKHLDHEGNGEARKEITFEECVKAFLNHRPVHGVSLSDISNALMTIADLTDPTDIIIERNELYKALEEKAEAMEHAEVLGYFCVLLLPKDENNPIPQHIGINEFAEKVFGIDLTITEDNVREITHAFEINK